MESTTRKLFSICVPIFVASVVGGVLALVLQWPAQLSQTLEGVLGSPNVRAASSKRRIFAAGAAKGAVL